jgi:hypothetical protein
VLVVVGVELVLNNQHVTVAQQTQQHIDVVVARGAVADIEFRSVGLRGVVPDDVAVRNRRSNDSRIGEVVVEARRLTGRTLLT